jgi:hypothetical protein
MTIAKQRESAQIVELRIQGMLSTVGIADAVSRLQEMVRMSDKSDSNLSEQLDEKELDLSESTFHKEENKKSFSQKIDEFRKGERETSPVDKFLAWEVIAGIIGIVLIYILSLGVILSGNLVLGVSILVVDIAIPLLTKTGRELMIALWSVTKELLELSLSEQTAGQSASERICSNCGWKNPEDNSYCHDCGIELGH